MSDKFKKENFPVDLGESFLGEWDADQGDITAKTEAAMPADVGVEQQQQQQQGNSGGSDLGAGDDFGWHPNEAF